jgi:hypothetical protein
MGVKDYGGRLTEAWTAVVDAARPVAAIDVVTTPQAAADVSRLRRTLAALDQVMDTRRKPLKGKPKALTYLAHQHHANRTDSQ